MIKALFHLKKIKNEDISDIIGYGKKLLNESRDWLLYAPSLSVDLKKYLNKLIKIIKKMLFYFLYSNICSHLSFQIFIKIYRYIINFKKNQRIKNNDKKISKTLYRKKFIC